MNANWKDSYGVFSYDQNSIINYVNLVDNNVKFKISDEFPAFSDMFVEYFAYYALIVVQK